VEVLAPETIAELARQERDKRPIGVGARYIATVVTLREKNWSFRAIAQWMAEQGIVLGEAGWRSAYDVHTGKKYKKK